MERTRATEYSRSSRQTKLQHVIKGLHMKKYKKIPTPVMMCQFALMKPRMEEQPNFFLNINTAREIRIFLPSHPSGTKDWSGVRLLYCISGMTGRLSWIIALSAVSVSGEYGISCPAKSRFEGKTSRSQPTKHRIERNLPSPEAFLKEYTGNTLCLRLTLQYRPAKPKLRTPQKQRRRKRGNLQFQRRKAICGESISG